jgi:hypothetical protein
MVTEVMAYLDKVRVPYDIGLFECWTAPELVRARWLLPDYYHPEHMADNNFPVELCKVCGLRDDMVAEEPYKLSEDVLSPGQEIWEGTSRIIIAEGCTGCLKMYSTMKLNGAMPSWSIVRNDCATMLPLSSGSGPRIRSGET